MYPVVNNAQRVSNNEKYEPIFNDALKGLKFPMSVQHIATFVKRVNKLKLVEGELSIDYNEIYVHRTIGVHPALVSKGNE